MKCPKTIELVTGNHCKIEPKPANDRISCIITNITAVTELIRFLIALRDCDLKDLETDDGHLIYNMSTLDSHYYSLQIKKWIINNFACTMYYIYISPLPGLFKLTAIDGQQAVFNPREKITLLQ